MSALIINANALNIPLADKSVQCVVTSPPYYGLRDYGVDGQIGLEVTPDEYIANLVAVFRECKRILRDDGTLWVNIGSSFVSGIIESQEYILRDDLTAEELEYVYSELAEHFKAQSKAVSDLWETNAPTEQEVSGLLRPGKSAA
jgi:DNA modification methylase